MTVSFAATSITVGEDETSATVCIDISGGLVGDITVLLSSTDASATGTYACVRACMGKPLMILLCVLPFPFSR